MPHPCLHIRNRPPETRRALVIIENRLLPLFNEFVVSWICSGSHYTRSPTYRRITPVILFYCLVVGQRLVTQTMSYWPADACFSQVLRAFCLVGLEDSGVLSPLWVSLSEWGKTQKRPLSYFFDFRMMINLIQSCTVSDKKVSVYPAFRTHSDKVVNISVRIKAPCNIQSTIKITFHFFIVFHSSRIFQYCLGYTT